MKKCKTRRAEQGYTGSAFTPWTSTHLTQTQQYAKLASGFLKKARNQALEEIPLSGQVIFFMFKLMAISSLVITKGKNKYNLDFYWILLICVIWCFELVSVLNGTPSVSITVFRSFELATCGLFIFWYFRKNPDKDLNMVLLNLIEIPPRLEPLVMEVHQELQSDPFDEKRLLTSLKRLFEFLEISEWRTDLNCSAVGYFFSNFQGWVKDRSALSSEIEELLEDIGLFLKYTVSDPEAAEKHQSTPEQLLARIEAIDA